MFDFENGSAPVLHFSGFSGFSDVLGSGMKG